MSLDMSKTHYLFARLKLFPEVTDMFLRRGDSPARVNEDGSMEFIFKTYVTNRSEARELLRKMRVFQMELTGVTDHLTRYIDCFDFDSKPGDREVDAATQRCARGES